jgi:Ser/Thr protein kinase RdoA (MazF antagonist)
MGTRRPSAPPPEAASEADLFLNLSPHRVLDAVEAADLVCNPVCWPLNSFENRVYEVELEDRTRVIAKFYRPGRWSKAQILEEHAFLEELAGAEIPVCTVQPFPDGQTLHELDGIYYCLFERRGGRAPEEVDDALAERLGMLTARIHQVGVGQRAKHRPRMSAQAWIRDNVTFLQGRRFLPEHLHHRYADSALALADEAERRLEGVPMHRLHGDLHLGNLLLREGVLNVLDFDDMVVGPAMQDLWLMIPGREPEHRRLRQVFLEGYERIRAFDRETLELLEPLRAMRRVHYAAWVARRWHDPLFPRTFPWFGTVGYWEQETRDLEELLYLIRHGDGEEPLGYDD